MPDPNYWGREAESIGILTTIVSSPIPEQTVAALQDNLDAWKGLGASVVALWRGRHLGKRLRMRILLVTGFFAATSILQVSTPSVITVNTANVTVISDGLEVNTMPGDIIELNLTHAQWSTDPSAKRIIGTLPLVWNQTDSEVGIPSGLNGT